LIILVTNVAIVPVVAGATHTSYAKRKQWRTYQKCTLSVHFLASLSCAVLSFWT